MFFLTSLLHIRINPSFSKDSKNIGLNIASVHFVTFLEITLISSMPWTLFFIRGKTLIEQTQRPFFLAFILNCRRSYFSRRWCVGRWRVVPSWYGVCMRNQKIYCGDVPTYVCVVRGARRKASGRCLCNAWQASPRPAQARLRTRTRTRMFTKATDPFSRRAVRCVGAWTHDLIGARLVRSMSVVILY